jgi:hypothetical protein
MPLRKKEDVMRILLFPLLGCIAVTLVAARPAAAQEVEPDSVFLQTMAAGSQCKIIPIIYKPHPPPAKVFFPPTVTASLSVDGCVCWKVIPPPTEWSVDFPYGSPFSGGKNHFENGDECGELASKGVYKYDLTVEGIPHDPWLDVGS